MSQSDPLADLHLKLKNPAQPFALCVTFTLKPGTATLVHSAAEQGVHATRQEPGNLAYEFHQSLSDPNTIFLFEKWKSLDALMLHLTLPHTERIIAVFTEHAAAPMKAEVLEFFAV